MDITFFMPYIDMVTAGICFCAGYVLKKYCRKMPNKYIPLCMLVVGGIINCLVHGELSGIVLMSGMISGLASTGMHETFKNVINNQSENIDS